MPLDDWKGRGPIDVVTGLEEDAAGQALAKHFLDNGMVGGDAEPAAFVAAAEADVVGVTW